MQISIDLAPQVGKPWAMSLIHASCVSIGGKGVLIRGTSGSGKSDLALRLIDYGARLVGDDYVELNAKGGALIATAPKELAGKIEARGLGILELPFTSSARIHLIVRLMPRNEIPRMPEDHMTHLMDVPLPYIMVDPQDASATAKIRLALGYMEGDG